ncbi:MAG: SIS domain-containing protein [Ruminococcaceae bacterium]|nr:SIS domain-containing protein [Oscillospiraceae bacterium]
MRYEVKPLLAVLERIDESAVECVTACIKTHRRVFVYGGGRSGLMLKAFAMRLAQAGYTVYVVGDVITPAIGKGDLLILASAGGTTATTCHYAQVAKTEGASVLALTAKQASLLDRLADERVYIFAPTKDDVGNTDGAPMGTLFEQALLLFGDAIIASLSADAAQMRVRHANLE